MKKTIRLIYDNDYGFVVEQKIGKEWETQNMTWEMACGCKCTWQEALSKALELAREFQCKIVAFTKEGKRRTVTA